MQNQYFSLRNFQDGEFLQKMKHKCLCQRCFHFYKCNKKRGRTLADPPNARGRKPNSVPFRVTIISLWTTVADGLEARYPSSTYGQQVADEPPEDCLRLHAVGFAVPRPSPERAVRSYRTFSTLPATEVTSAVCFLWHFP